MATSGSTDFTRSTIQVVKGALRCLGQLNNYETLPDEEYRDAVEALNMIIKGWMSPSNQFCQSFKAFALERQDLTLAAQISYELKSSGGDLNVAVPVDVISAVRKTTDDTRSPLDRMTLGEYEALNDRTATGAPTKYHYERGIDVGTLYLNRIPDDTTDIIQLIIRRTLEDLDATSDNLDLPVEWIRPLKFQLAIDLAPEYGIIEIGSIMALLQTALEDCNVIDDELVHAYFEPAREY
jgi:hypothetical protein